MKPELLPCPLCGGGAELWKAHEAHPPRKAWIACMDRCCAFITQEHMTDAEAIAAWNQRAEPKPDEALVDELALAFDQYLTHNIERDTLACDLTPDELTDLAKGAQAIMQAHITAREQAARNKALDEADLDWREIGKLAGEHGVRFRTNRALVQFLNAILKEQHNG